MRKVILILLIIPNPGNSTKFVNNFQHAHSYSEYWEREKAGYFFTEEKIKSCNAKDYGASGNGVTDDAFALTRWLNAGPLLYLPKGIYRIKTQILSSVKRNNLSITAHKDAKIIVTEADFNQNSSLLRIENVTNLIIQNLVIQQYGLLNDTARPATIGNGTQASIRLEKDSNVLINNCIFLQVSKSAIYIDSCSNVLVSNCKVPDTFGYGFGIFYSTNSIFRNNYLKGAIHETVWNYPNGNSGIGILAAYGNKIVIEKNYIDNFVNTGTKTEGVNYVYYQNNIVKNSGKDGIKIQASPNTGIDSVAYVLVANNIVQHLRPLANDGTSLIQLWDVKEFIVTNNICTGGTRGSLDGGYEAGIKIFASSPTFITQKGKISNNTIDSVGQCGIYLLNASNIDIEKNLITNYAIDHRNAHGIWVNVADNISLSNNKIIQVKQLESSISCGINIQLCHNIFSTNNTIINPAFEGIRVQILNGDFIDISHNWIFNPSEKGINAFGESGTIKNIKLNWNVILNANRVGSAILLDNSKIAITNLSICNNLFHSAFSAPTFTVTGSGIITNFIKENNFTLRHE